MLDFHVDSCNIDQVDLGTIYAQSAHVALQTIAGKLHMSENFADVFSRHVKIYCQRTPAFSVARTRPTAKGR